MNKITAICIAVLLLSFTLTACSEGETAMNVGGSSVSQNEYRYYFYGNVYKFMQMYGSMLDGENGFTLDVPLSEQMCYEGVTWQDFFCEQTTETLWTIIALSEEARASGLTTGDDIRQSVDEYIVSSYGEGADLSVILKQLYGGTLNEKSLRAILERELLVQEFYNTKSGELAPTQSEAEAYGGEGGRRISVRHILFSSENSDAATARAEAEALYANWLEGDASEDSFSQLATEHTEDYASAESGGLYTDVAQGDMVAPFDEWCFDESRSYGDSGLVDTNYGTHIMFFVESEISWDAARDALLSERLSQYISDLKQKYPMQPGIIDVTLEPTNG